MENPKINLDKEIFWNKLILMKSFKYQINFQDLEANNNKKIALQIIDDQNYQVFKKINLFFWLRLITKCILVIISATKLLITLFNRELSNDLTQSFYIISFISFLFYFFSYALSGFKYKFVNWRMIYFKAKYLVDNQIDLFTQNDFVLLSLNALDKNDFFNFGEENTFEQRNNDQGTLTLKKYKKQVFYMHLQWITILLIVVLMALTIIVIR